MFSLADSRRIGVRFMSASLAATVLLTGACSDDDDGVTPRTATTITVSGGNTQTGTVGAALAQPLIVTVRDQNGTLLAGQTVTFATTSGGMLGATTVTTNAQGQAQTTYTLGNTAGTQTVTARVAGVTTPATFTFTGNALAAAQLAIISGNTQTGTVGAALAQPLIVTVRDQNGTLMAGQTVTFATTSGGMLGTTTVTTNAQGQAQTTYTLGNTAGAQTVTAMVAGITTPATFTFTGNASAAAQLAIISGNQQTGMQGTALTAPFTIEARDQFGNPAQNAAITWNTTAGTFAASPAATTDAAGRATAVLMLPATAGAVTVTARIGTNAASTVTFTATAQ